MRDEQVIILGGGIAGLATGYELKKRGIPVTVLERNPYVGGLARTITHEGFRFDIGGHRFHSNNPDVVDWLKNLLADDLLTVPRTSHIRMNGKYVSYPIEFPGALTIFPFLTSVGMVMSYAKSQFTDRDKDVVSFEDWVVQRFGRGLYDIYFKPYTEKVWGIRCDELSAMWAAQRISLPSLTETVMTALRTKLQPGYEPPKTAIKEFYYPREGFGMITDALADYINDGDDSQVITGATVTGVDPDANTVTYKIGDTAHTINGSRIVSTLPLSLLFRMLPEDSGAQAVVDANPLSYRDLIVAFIALETKQVSGDSWTYFPSKDLIFGRTHEPKNWSMEMVPSDKYTSLAVELFTSREDELWQLTDDEILQRIIKQMDDIDWIDTDTVHNGWLQRVPFAYPVYYIGYEEKLRAYHNFLERYNNISLVGRTGSFKYMNSDGVIEDVFRLMNELMPDNELNIKPLQHEVERWA